MFFSVLFLLSLTFMKKSQTTELPRIWWCATGPLAFLPLHAAGQYRVKEPSLKAYDFFVSSYTPTLTALLDATHTTKLHNFQLLAIAQPFTQGYLGLPNTTQELNRIKGHAQHAKLAVRILEGDDATVGSVVDYMKKCSWLHLACHGEQNVEQPLKSALLLQDDGRLELEEIINMPLPNAEFVFMSACQTATGNKNLSEEAVHLAAGMLLAGYRGVIATMWSIQDKYAPIVADDVYARLFVDGQPDHTQAAHALHHAVRRLRERPGVSFASWVPFIHIGM
jgi:CHAT domain-containing protein